jgi:hypothetical protein
LLTRAIVRSYLSMVVARLTTLYAFPSGLRGTRHRRARRTAARALRDLQPVAAELRGTGRGVLALIAGGVVISTLASLVLAVARAAVRDWVVGVLVLGCSWVACWCSAGAV